MKVPDSSSKAAGPAGGAGKPAAKPAEPGAGKGSSFARLLKKPMPEGDLSGAIPQPLSLMGRPAPVEETAKSGAPALVQGLGHEIVANLDADKQKIQIRFDSKTLDGLEVEITRDRGKISIRFEPKTERAHAALAPGIEQLSQTLAANGVPVATIQLRPPSGGVSTGGERRGGGGQQQGGQQRQR